MRSCGNLRSFPKALKFIVGIRPPCGARLVLLISHLGRDPIQALFGTILLDIGVRLVC